MADACAPAGARGVGSVENMRGDTRGCEGAWAWREWARCVQGRRGGARKISLRGFYGYKECKFGNCGWNYQ